MKHSLTKQGVYKNLVAKGIDPKQALAMAKGTQKKNDTNGLKRKKAYKKKAKKASGYRGKK